MTVKMTMMVAACMAMSVALAGCGADLDDERTEVTLSKAQVRAMDPADVDRDYCAAYGWYDDDVCDDFCPEPDAPCTAGPNHCADLACGAPCDPCFGRGPDCVAIGALTYCNADQRCVADAPEALGCNGYDPCAGLSCGDLCAPCDPNDPECINPGGLLYCNSAGACVYEAPTNLGCGTSRACEGLSCGEPCNPCEGRGPDCIAPGATTFCDADLQCVPGNPQTISCG